MHLHAIDILIIAGYLLITIGIGFWISKKASRNIQHYFLGGNKLPWYVLGLSNASGMFDISGTMWMAYLLFVYGLKSVWIPWLWPVFNQVILMVYLSIWLRRSNVMTGAEWIKFRFGENKGARLAHIIVIVFAIVNVIGFLAYAFIGIGKFAATFLPFHLSQNPAANINLYGLIIVTITTLYVVKGGMYSVVLTEVLQFLIMTIACIWVGIIAMQHVTPDMLSHYIPKGWQNIFFGWKLNLNWNGILDSANRKIQQDGYNLFTIFFVFMLFKGLLQSGAGPLPNYDMQRVLSAKTPKEAAKMSGFVSVVLLIPRYMLITGLTILALVFFSSHLNAMGNSVDYERILPFAMRNFVPAGLLGLLIAALIAAFMSTFAATVNAAPAYIVNDIYKRYLKPNASDKEYVKMSYLISILVVMIGILIGLFVHSLNDMIQWIVAALYGGYTASNLLKWHWWRFNSYGYFWGMVTGILSAVSIPGLLYFIPTLYTFPIILLISVVGCVVGSLLTEPDDMEVLKNFYMKVRPWGFWKPVHDELVQDYPELEANKDFKRDMFNIFIGIVWQTALTAAGIYLVIQDYNYLIISAAIILITSLILKFSWYDNLQDYPQMPEKVNDSPLKSGDMEMENTSSLNLTQIS